MILLLATALAGISSPVPDPIPPTVQELVDEQLQRVVITVDGAKRTAWVHIPDDYASSKEPWPVVYALHGGKTGHTGLHMAPRFTSQMDGRAILVFPSGWRGGGLRSWNHAVRSDGDPLRDIAFLAALQRHLRSTYRIDPEKEFLTGFSAGAALGWNIVCTEPTMFDRYAMASKGLPLAMEADCKAGPTPMMLLYGTADPKFGGHPLAHSARETAKRWGERNHCAKPTTKRSDPDPSQPTSLEIEDRVCEGAPLSAVWVVDGAHSWPGSVGPDREDHSKELDASELVLDFFLQSAGK